MRFKRVDQVVRWRLCSGCGACTAVCPSEAIRLVDVVDQGIRPVVDSLKCRTCGDCVKVCPGIEISHSKFNGQTIPLLRKEWGPVLEVWEGYATDPEIRYKGSSGGMVTALALYCLEEEWASGVLHITAKSDAPLKNISVFSRTKRQLLDTTGSRYSPAAACEKLEDIERAKSHCVFIGKGCDVAALRKSQAGNKELNDKVCLAISIFCAGTPATQATHNLLKALGVKPEEVEELRYRGCGWPGAASVKIKGDGGQIRRMTYEQAWGDILSKHTQFRCRLCPDSTGELADISCGDPWYRKPESSEPGMSLVLVRTEKGRKFVEEAVEAGYIQLQRADPSALPLSQKSLEMRRRHLWGRLLAMRLFLIPVPKYKGFHLFSNWWGLPAREKARSIGGTLKRILQRNWRKPLNLSLGE